MADTEPKNNTGNSPIVQEGWESERDTERAKISIRVMAIFILLGTAFWLRGHANGTAITNRILFGLAVGAALMTLAEAWYLYRPGCVTIPRWFKYVTVAGDMAFVSVLIFDTGASRSPFFFVYFVFLISNCLRYGLRMSLFVALLFNILYAMVLGLASAADSQTSVQGGEGLKFLAFWAIAFYGGSVSERFRRQAGQLRVYEETLLELRARLRTLTEASPQSASPHNAESVPAKSETTKAEGEAPA